MLLLSEGVAAEDCSHLKVEVEACAVKVPRLDAVDSPFAAPINGKVVEMQVAEGLQVQLLPIGSSRSEGYSHL
jgi:hypothetical protein